MLEKALGQLLSGENAHALHRLLSSPRRSQTCGPFGFVVGLVGWGVPHVGHFSGLARSKLGALAKTRGSKLCRLAWVLARRQDLGFVVVANSC